MSDTPRPIATDRRIIAEVYRAIELLGGMSCILSTIGSWGDTLPDEDILANLREWNKESLARLQKRVTHLRDRQDQRDAAAARFPVQPAGEGPPVEIGLTLPAVQTGTAGDWQRWDWNDPKPVFELIRDAAGRIVDAKYNGIPEPPPGFTVEVDAEGYALFRQVRYTVAKPPAGGEPDAPHVVGDQ